MHRFGTFGRWLVIGLVLWPASVFAHVPVFTPDTTTDWETALVLPNARTSWAIYARLVTPNELDFYRFTGMAGDPLLIEMTVPGIAGLEDFAPSFALVGPGLPTDDSAMPRPFLLNQGAIVVPHSGATAQAQTHGGRLYWVRDRLATTLPATGEYYVLVWHPEAALGKYVLAVGDIERRASVVPGVSGDIASFFADPRGPDLPIVVPATLPATAGPYERRWWIALVGFSLVLLAWKIRPVGDDLHQA